jgi:hypothetical protein
VSVTRWLNLALIAFVICAAETASAQENAGVAFGTARADPPIPFRVCAHSEQFRRPTCEPPKPDGSFLFPLLKQGLYKFFADTPDHEGYVAEPYRGSFMINAGEKVQLPPIIKLVKPKISAWTGERLLLASWPSLPRFEFDACSLPDTPAQNELNTITDMAGNALAAVRIELMCIVGQRYRTLGRTVTDSNGKFDIKDDWWCKGDTTIVAIDKTGYKPELRFVRHGDKVPAVELEVAAAPVSRTESTDGARRHVREMVLVESLPLPGIRSLDDLALLSPGVLPPPATNSTPGPGISASVGTAGQFTVNGLRSRDNNFTVDGSDNNEEDVGVRRQGFVALTPQPIESIAELQVVTAMGDARFGRNMAGMSNVLSRSGSTILHGTAYLFLNDRRLNARNFFDSTSGSGPLKIALPAEGKTVQLDGVPLMVRNPQAQSAPYTRLQGGFVLGGPLAKPGRGARTFFFTTLEKQDIHSRQQAHFSVPDVKQRGVFETGDRGFFRRGSQLIPMSPASLPGNAIFSLYPFPNNPAGPYGRNTYSEALSADAAAVVGSVKLDHYFQVLGWSNAITGRYNVTDENSVLPVTGGGIYSSLAPRLRTQNLAFYLNTNFTANTAQTVRVSFGRTSSNFDPVQGSGLLPSRELPSVGFLLNAPLLLNVTNPNSPNPQYLSAQSSAGSARNAVSEFSSHQPF